jgi:predicted metal-dependent hydrolase
MLWAYKDGVELKKYIYENATVYITKPTEQHKKNIQKATEDFLKKIMKERLQNDCRKNNRRTGVINSNTRKRDRLTSRREY